MVRSVSPLGMAKLDLPRTIRLHLDTIRYDIYLCRIYVSNELGKHRADERLHPTCDNRQQINKSIDRYGQLGDPRPE